MSFNSSPLSELTSYVNRGITPKYTEDGECYVINQKCIRDNFVDFSLVRKNDITKRKVTPDKTIQIQDILVNSTGVGTLGRVAQVKNTKGILTCDSHVTIVRPNKEKIYPVYLGYYLYGKQNEIESMAQGSTGQTELSRHRLGDLEIHYPSINEQKTIANILSSLDDKIELNNKINKNLEEMAQTLYKRWFVDFEFPNEDGEPYKSSGGEMVESELGLIPKGWQVKLITDLFEFKGGSQPPKSEHLYEYKKGYVRFIQNRDFRDGSDHLTYIKISKNNRTAEKFDILMDKYGEVGKIRYGLKGAYNVALAKIDPINSFDLELLRGYFSQNNIREYLTNSSIASTRGSLNATTFTGLKISYAPLSIKEQFSVFQRDILSMILKNKQENFKINQLRDTLLPKLMNGEIEV